MDINNDLIEKNDSTNEKSEEAKEIVKTEKTELTAEAISEIKKELTPEEKNENRLNEIESILDSIYYTISYISKDLDDRKRECIIINKQRDVISTLDKVTSTLEIATKTIESTLLDMNELYVYYDHLPILSSKEALKALSKDISNIKDEIIRTKRKMTLENKNRVFKTDSSKLFDML